jgi:hypothetical protein
MDAQGPDRWIIGPFGRHEAIGFTLARHMAEAGERQMHTGDQHPVTVAAKEREEAMMAPLLDTASRAP